MRARFVPHHLLQAGGSGSAGTTEVAPEMKEVSALQRNPELPEAPYAVAATDDSIPRRGDRVLDPCGKPVAALRLDGLQSQGEEESDITSILPIGRSRILTAVGNMLDVAAPKVEARVFRARQDTREGEKEGPRNNFS